MRRIKLTILLGTFLLGALMASGQKITSPATTTQPRTTARQPSFRLRVSSKNGLTLITLRAEKAPLAEVANELARQLKIQVLTGREMRQQYLTLKFRDLPLEAAMRLLSPQVYIDYESSGNDAAHPKAIGVYLYAMNEVPPSSYAVVNNDSEALLFEGDTDEVTSAPAKNPDAKGEQTLRIKYERGLLSVEARHQPLAVILYKIANQVGLPFAMRSGPGDFIDTDFSGLTLEEAVRRLSPNVRLYIRTNLQSLESRPLRLVSDSPQ